MRYEDLRLMISDCRLIDRRAGFSLLELIVVIGVIAILVGILFPAVSSARAKARQREATAIARALENAITTYHAEYGKWPYTDARQETQVILTDAQSIDAVNKYLLMSGSENPRRVIFWEAQGGVTNYGDITYKNANGQYRLFKIAINPTMNYWNNVGTDVNGNKVTVSSRSLAVW